MKGTAAALGVVCLSPLLLAGTAVIAAAGAGPAAAAACSTGTVDVEAVAEQVRAILGGEDAEGIRIDGLDLPGEQIPHARTIVATGISLRVPERGQVVALATALQESRLRNLNYGDRDSLGLFQQRPSQGWGTPEQVRDPVHASTRFYRALLETSGWQQMTITQAAQAVQKSGYPDAYAQWEPLARALRQAVVDALPRTDRGQEGESGQGQGGTPAAGAACAPGQDGSGFGPIPAGTVPTGYEIPEYAPRQVRTAIRWALGQLGTPYQWGGTCTNARGPDPMGRCDCSSLMQQAYAAAKVTLTRTTYTQVHEGRAVPVRSLEPGDLLFTRGSAARPEHVGMYIGSGLVVNAPRTGTVVRIEPLKDWTPQILAARRVVPA